MKIKSLYCFHVNIQIKQIETAMFQFNNKSIFKYNFDGLITRNQISI